MWWNSNIDFQDGLSCAIFDSIPYAGYIGIGNPHIDSDHRYTKSSTRDAVAFTHAAVEYAVETRNRNSVDFDTDV